MKALVKTQKGSGFLEVWEVPVPKISATNQVLVKVKAAGICGTDLHIWHDTFTYYPPVILGHEFSGEVAQVGEGVTRLVPGDGVVVEPHAKACAVCESCRTGSAQLCKSKRSPGWGQNGAFADYVVIEEHLLHKIPEGVPYDIAALAEPFAIVIHEVLERGVVEPGDTVVVVGAGSIGLMSAFAAKKAGAGQVIVLGTNADEGLRFPVAKKLGIKQIVNVQKKNAVARVMELTNGRGADLVVEASGAEQGIRTAAEVVRVKGRIAAIGMISTETVAVPWNKLIYKVVDLRFNFSSSYTAWRKVMGFIAGETQALSALITRRASIDEWESVFGDIEQGRSIKTLFIPSGEE